MIKKILLSNLAQREYRDLPAGQRVKVKDSLYVLASGKINLQYLIDPSKINQFIESHPLLLWIRKNWAE